MVYVIDIAGHPLMPTERYGKVRRLLNTNKARVIKRCPCEYIVKGFRLFDKVKYISKEYFIFGRRASGFFDIRDLQGNKVNNGSISYKKIKYLYTPNSYLTERRIVGSA